MDRMIQDKSIYRKKILCVDDDESIRGFLVKSLRSWEFRAQAATTGKDAMTKIQQNNYDLVITDFRMPDMNGRELAKYVKEKNPQCPVILFTGSVIPLDPEIEKGNGIDAIIRKPVSVETLYDEILKCLKEKNEREISMK